MDKNMEISVVYACIQFGVALHILVSDFISIEDTQWS